MWPFSIIIHLFKWLFNEQYRQNYWKEKNMVRCLKALKRIAELQGQPVGSILSLEHRAMRVKDWTVSLRNYTVKAEYDTTALTRNQRNKVRELVRSANG